MTWSGFCNVPRYSVGFESGMRKPFDKGNIISLEALSVEVQKLDPGRHDYFLFRPHQVAGAPVAHVAFLRRSNLPIVPYFRFAMAYKP
jgi:hypothetical protein